MTHIQIHKHRHRQTHTHTHTHMYKQYILIANVYMFTEGSRERLDNDDRCFHVNTYARDWEVERERETESEREVYIYEYTHALREYKH